MKSKWILMGVFFFILAWIVVLFTGIYAKAAGKPPVKMGVLLALSGPHAAVGQTTLDGVKLAFEKRDYKVGGRKVDLIIEDEEGKPDVALMKTKKLVERDKVEVIFGPVSSASAYAIREYLRGAKVLLMMCGGAAASGLTRENMSPYNFRVWHGNIFYYGGKWAVEKMGCRKVIFSGVDFAFGRELAEAFIKGFTRGGGNVIGEMYTALGTKDFGPYITKIGKLADETGADCCAFVYSGSDAVAFVKQFQEYGVKDKFRVNISFGATYVGKLLNEMGEAATGHYDVNAYYRYADNPGNREFVKLVEKKFGPGYMELMTAIGYLGADVVCQAVEKIKGNIEDKGRFLEVLRNIRFDSHFGPFEFDPRDQNFRENVRILRSEMVRGKVDQVLAYELPKTEDWWWLERKEK